MLKVWGAVIRQTKASVILIQETKISSDEDRVVKEIWRGNFIKWASLEQSGSSGANFLLLGSHWVSLKASRVGEFFA